MKGWLVDTRWSIVKEYSSLIYEKIREERKERSRIDFVILCRNV